MNCVFCGKELIGHQTRYCSHLCSVMFAARRRGVKPHKSGRGWSDEERLLHYRAIDKTTGCWNWTGTKHGANRSYGVVKSNLVGRGIGVHRLAAVLWLGLDPARSELHVCHKCDNPRCFNPDHLYVGTHADNMRDRKERGGYDMMKGEMAPRHKLNWEAARLIRELSFKGYSGERLGRAFGVSPYVIRKVLRNESWVEAVG